MSRLRFRLLSVLAVAGLAGVVVAAQPAGADENNARHVLLLSVDGLHQSDLTWYVHKHPDSALGKLVREGASFTNAMTPFPSDSFPGMVAQVTGGSPKTTGVYYDDSFNHMLFPPAGYDKTGTPNPLHDCSGQTPGTEVTYFEAAAKNPLSLDSGQGLAGLPDSILNLTSNATSLIDPQQLPRDNSCNPVYPHQYLRVNTVFEVARAGGLRTAWSDKHAAYEILGGPSGAGIQDYFTPEINSNASFSGAADWTKDNALTQIYDGYKVQAVINEINGFDHSGKTHVGTPAIFGMNFQTISTAQKLPGGGYKADGLTANAMLEGGLDYINAKIAAFQAAIEHRGLADKTTIILSAKHGQSPMVPTDLTRIDDGAIVDQLNADWKAAGHAGDLVAFAINDDGWLMWTTDRSAAATTFAKNHLLSYSGTGNNIFGKAKPYTNSGLGAIYTGNDLLTFLGETKADERTPDVIGVAKLGTVYTGGKGKIAEHGGDNPPDRHVPIVVFGPGAEEGKVVNSSVDTTEIGPTILQLLGLDPNKLQAVQKEGTKALAIG